MPISKRIEEELGLEEKEAIQEYCGIARIIGVTYLLLAEKLKETCGDLSGTILDLGTGLGDFAFFLAKSFPSASIVGLDISEDILKEAQKRRIKEGIKNISFCLMDVHKLYFKDNSIDLVASHGSLHHWYNPKEVFQEIWRVLKKNSFALIVDLRRDAPQEVVEEAGLMLNKAQKRGFLDSLKASYLKEELEDMLNRAGIKGFSLEEQGFSRKIVMRNLSALKNTLYHSDKFNKLYLNLWVRKQ